MRLLLVWLCLVLSVTPARADTLRLAVTTSFENSGLSDVLLPRIRQDTGLDVQLIVVGTGQALRLGRAGDVDAVLVHSKAAEVAFVAEGHATHRREIMYNDFVFVGPKNDPSALRGAADAREAMRRLASGGGLFVSRGDDSGTHRKELALWQSAGAPPLDPGWYRETGGGMGATLNIAAAMGAYTLSDRASWLSFGNPRDLTLIFAGDPALFNQYAYLPINPARHPHVNAAGARRLGNWMTGPAARALINGYRLNGEQLFTFNASP